MRTRDRPALAGWLERAETSSLPEIRSFTAGLRRDQAAVEAAVSSAWSNGQTEGQITRLKCQMYGRARHHAACFPGLLARTAAIILAHTLLRLALV